MPKADELVINTGPLIALTAALGDLRVLKIYSRVWVPYEVQQEILHGGAMDFAVAEFQAAIWLRILDTPLQITPLLRRLLDVGEASVIQLAQNRSLQTVCIDEAAGRRIARMSGLQVTGSLGILLRALRGGYTFSMHNAIQRMQQQGVWLSADVVKFALSEAEQISGLR
jgi:predicted nucleic acid-binding protein